MQNQEQSQETAQVSAILAELWASVVGSGWSEASALEAAAAACGRLVSLLPAPSYPRARRDAGLLEQAFQRIERGHWPTAPQVREFLGDGIRAVALRCGVAPFWKEEDVERLAAAAAPPPPVVVMDEPEPAEETAAPPAPPVVVMNEPQTAPPAAENPAPAPHAVVIDEPETAPPKPAPARPAVRTEKLSDDLLLFVLRDD
jgi:hypothetical protein